ncbi:MAG: GNAT family N-acetyltransferase [Novosphingobium sp.]
MTSSTALARDLAPRAAVPAHAPAPCSPSPRGLVLTAQEYSHAHAIAQWDALAAQAVEPNPFFESWYLLPSQRALDPRGQVRLFVLEQGGQWLGMVPVTASRKYYGRPIPNLSSWLHPNCFHGAPLVRAGHEAAFFRALFHWADLATKTALFLHLGHMPLDGPVHQAMLDVAASEQRKTALVFSEDRVVLRTELSSQDYARTALTGRKAKDFRRQRRNLSAQGNLAAESLTGTEGLDEWIAEFMALEAAGWKGAAGSALACHDYTAVLFHQAMQGAAARGQLERWALTLNGRRIAMLSVLLSGQGAFAYKTAFDEGHATNSPGALLHVDYLATLDRPTRAWTDSCANVSHPMIPHIWRETRGVGRYSIAIGGPLRRLAFAQLARMEQGKLEQARNPDGATTA